MDQEYEFSDLSFASNSRQCPDTFLDLGVDLNSNNSNSSTPSPSASSNSSQEPNNSVPKPKRRNTEKRRQQALVASRNRRGAEAGLFQDLGQALPVTAPILKSLDKLGVLRVAVSYLKLQSMLERLDLNAGEEEEKCECPDPTPPTVEMEPLLRDGFIIVMETNGDIVYVSDNVSKCLRYEKHTMLGTNIYEHICTSDRPAMDRLLSVQNMSHVISTSTALGNVFTNQTTLKTPRQTETIRLDGPPGSGQVIRVTGKLFLSPANVNTSAENFFVGVVEPLNMLDPHSYEYPFPQFRVTAVLDFVCTADMKCVTLDVKMGIPAVYDREEMVGVSVFEFLHAEDVNYVRDGLKWMYAHGQVQSHQGYRMLIKHGGWAWFMTQASTMQVVQQGQQGKGDSKEGSLTPVTYCVGRHFMVSDVYEPGKVLAPIQLGKGALPIHSGIASEDPEGPEWRALLPNPEEEDPDLALAPLGPDSASDLDLDLDMELLSDADAWLEELSVITADSGVGRAFEPVPQSSPSLVQSASTATSRTRFPQLTSLLLTR